MTDIHISLRFLQELYHLHYATLSDLDSVQDFITQFRFRNVPSVLSKDYLVSLCKDSTNEILYITDPFLLHCVLFPFEETFILLGPFSSSTLSSAQARNLLERNSITDHSVNEFFSYYNLFPVLSETQILHIVDSLYAVYGIPNSYRFQKRNFVSHSKSQDSCDDTEQIKLKNLKQRYYFEQQFFIAIEQGNVRNALTNLHNMQADVKHLKRKKAPLESEKQAAAITRTTVRLAALQAGLPIYLIDRLSQNGTVATMNAGSESEVLQATEHMIREFCSAIRENNNTHYCATVQSILYFFEHNYPREITLNELSEDLELSKKQIITVFKKETGITPISYLTKLRLRQASSLLSGTSMPLRKIAEAVGIPDENYFIKLFKREYGITPTLYRRQYF